MKPKLLGLLLATHLCFFLCSAGLAKENAKNTIKIATLAPQGSMSGNLLSELNEKIIAETQNDVGFKIYFGGVQGDAQDVLRKIKFKQLHGAMLPSYGLGQIASDIRVTGLPYIFRNYEEVRYVRDKLEDHMNNALKAKGFVALGWYDIGFVYSFSKVPITSVEIARQQKFWAPEGDPLAKKVYEVIGITPVSLSITDVLTSLSTRLVDAASAPPIAAVGFRWYTKFQYMTEYPSTNVVGALVVDKETFDKISPANQEKVLGLSREYCLKIQAGHQKENAKSIDLLKKSGISIVRNQDDKAYQKFIDETAQKTMDGLVGECYSRELLDKTLAYLKEYRDLHPESAVARIE